MIKWYILYNNGEPHGIARPPQTGRMTSMEYPFSNRIADMKPSAIREILKNSSNPAIIPFAAGNPAPEAFPVEQIRRISDTILAGNPLAALQYSVTDGVPALKIRVRAMLEEDGLVQFSDDLLITSGAQQAIELACKVLCNEGDTVIAEEPSFIGSLNSFRSFRAHLVGVPMEEDGMEIAKLEQALKENPNTKLIYIIPNFQNPSGRTTSFEKRQAVYELAKRYGVCILEDNPYGKLRFAGEDIPSIKSFDTDGIVIYCGTFSKILSPGLRVGYALAPAPIISKMIVAKQCGDVHTTALSQMICERFLVETDMHAHYDMLRAIYRRKSGLMLKGMEAWPETVRFTRPEGGLFIWCTLPEGADMLAFVKKALAKGVAVVPGIAFNTDESAPSQSFRCNFSTPSDEAIVRGTDILGTLLQEEFR